MSTGKEVKKGATKAISVRLLVMFVAMLIASILIAEVLILGFGYNMVKNLIDTSLTNQVTADAAQINKDLNSIFYYLNGVADAVEQNDFANNSEIMEYMAGTVGRYNLIPTGAYLALNDETFIYPSSPDYVMENVTQHAWYIQAVGYDNS